MPTVNYLGTESNGELGNYDSVFIAVYDTDLVSSGYLDTTFNYTVDCMQNVYSRGYISGYKISKRSVNDWTPNCCGDDVIAQWDNLRDELSLTRQGDHALIHTCSQDDCKVSSGTSNGDNPWKTDIGSVGTTDAAGDNGTRSEANVAETIMHENLHAHCRSNLCPKVEDDTDGGNEHHLGIIREENGIYKETPLGSKGAADDGSCVSESVDTNGYTSNLSLCEASGMENSAEHTAGYHDCSKCTK